MNKKFNKIGVIFLSFVMILSLAACSNKDNQVTEETNSEKFEIVESVDEISLQESELPEADSVEISDKTIDKPKLGIRMTLTNNFADCEVKDLSAKDLTNISPEAIGGFSLVKGLAGEEYILSNLAVVPTTVVATPEESSRFPYLFRGNNYTIVATMPEITEANGIAYQEAVNIQSGIMMQLASVKFDESTIVIETNIETTELVE